MSNNSSYTIRFRTYVCMYVRTFAHTTRHGWGGFHERATVRPLPEASMAAATVANHHPPPPPPPRRPAAARTSTYTRTATATATAHTQRERRRASSTHACLLYTYRDSYGVRVKAGEHREIVREHDKANGGCGGEG
ncbi:hypothetical protein GY45DRAFT_668236 [Cubamyces sp. BRFM 1775]|nr:hypothetical protein GY45DRAFT_668236 [Cubamyces sp. BRFM 1775]